MFATTDVIDLTERATAPVGDGLNDEQRAAVHHRDGHLLVVAGAGTGKTRTLVTRVVSLVDEGVDPNRILLLTFTRRAAAEMIQRVRAGSTNRAAGSVWGGTFHAVANRLLRRFGAQAGLPSSFTVLDSSDAVDLFALVRNEAGLGERSKRFPRPNTIASIYSSTVNSQAKLDDVLRTEFPWCADHQDDLRDVFKAYTARKRRSAVLDFDDLLLFWRQLCLSPAGESLRTLFDHILIDEYQDTNPIQADVVEGMTGPRTTVCAVGDDAQAIYGFRSATVANMWNFEERFQGARRIALERNYRSTNAVLGIANAVISQPIGGESPHFAKSLFSLRGVGVQPQLVTCHDEAAQSTHVADRILAARERGVDLRDQAVLFRAGHHSHGLELELTRRDIPFVKYGGLKHLESAHVKDLLALLRILDNPDDELAWHRILSSLDGVGPATERRLSGELGIDVPEVDALHRFLHSEVRLPSSAAEQATELRRALGDCSQPENGELPPAEQVGRLRPFCELLFASKYEHPEPRLADLDALARTAEQYRTRNQMLVELTLDPPGVTGDLAVPPHLDDDWLTLSTIHSAKGLEWSHVHLIHAADGNIPSDMAIGDREGMAEELRLLYVALTRAKDELTVSYPLRFHVNRFGSDDRHVYAQPSRFLDAALEQFDQVGDVSTDPRTGETELAFEGNPITAEVDTMLSALWD